MTVQANNKNRGGRPPLTTKRFRKYFTLTLHEGIDDDLISWFDSIPKGKMANSIKTALRQGGVKSPEKSLEADELISDDMLDLFLSAL